MADFPIDGWTLREAGLDYLTLTSSNPETQQELADHAFKLQRAEQARGEKTRPFVWKGYTGFTTGQLTYAVRADGTLYRVSSALAARVHPAVCLAHTHCTRLDIQSTWHTTHTDVDIAAICAAAARAHASERGKTLKVTLVDSGNLETTCYIGSRTSDLFARIYNKALESRKGEYANCWRWEIECKGRASEHLWSRSAPYLGLSTYLADYLSRYFTERDIPYPQLPRGAGTSRIPQRAPSSAAKRLEWLRSQVRPAIAGIIQHYDYSTLFDALGLDAAAVRTVALERSTAG